LVSKQDKNKKDKD